MFMKKAFAAVLATAVLVAGAVEAKDLRVASNTTFPPFEFVNTKTQEITGFEMDLIRAMGKQIGEYREPLDPFLPIGSVDPMQLTAILNRFS